MNVIYVVTVLREHHDKVWESRSMGWYSDQNKAIDAVERNVGSIEECLYNWCVIEEFREGMMAVASDHPVWFRWTPDNKWESTATPEWSKGTVNWGLG
jgi:hypothetical protein